MKPKHCTGAGDGDGSSAGDGDGSDAGDCGGNAEQLDGAGKDARAAAVAPSRVATNLDPDILGRCVPAVLLWRWFV